MLMRGDFDLDLLQRYTYSFTEVIKHTMLKQDVIFRKQVHELHRLYGVQISLMNDLGCDECNTYNSGSAEGQPSLLFLTNPTRYEPLSKVSRFSSVAKVGSTPFVNQELLEGRERTYCRLQQSPLYLQLSADEFINHVGDDLPWKGNTWINSKEPVDFNHPLSSGNTSGPEDLKLSLSIGEYNKTTAGTMRTWFEKRTDSCSQSVVDLEESVERISDGCAALETYSKGKDESQFLVFHDPIASTSVKKDPSLDIADSGSFQECGDCCQEQTSSSEGVREHLDDVPCNNLSIKRQLLNSYQGGVLDLNKTSLEESSCYSNDPGLVYPSTASSAGGSGRLTGSIQEGTCLTTFCRKEFNKRSNETSDVLGQDNISNLAPMDFNSKNTNTDISVRNSKYNGRTGGVVSHLGPESICTPPQADISEGLGNCSGDHKTDNVELKSKFANALIPDSSHTSISTREVSCEKSEVHNTVFSCTDQSQNKLQDENGSKSPASCKSCSSDNDSSCVLNQYSKSHSGSQVADVLSGDHDLRTSDTSDLRIECHYKKEESAEVDISIQRAAESLIHISLDNSAGYQDSYAKLGSKEMQNEKTEQLQHSCDSFELIALELTETNMDIDSVSSKPFEVNDENMKDFSFKLRRGRRLKDFQREILPSLASLSRHEILEDINIMEGVLRSREYRKLRGKTAAHAGNWPALVRSRRSRVNYVGRRNFS